MRATLNAVRSKCGALVVPSSDIAMRWRSRAVDIWAPLPFRASLVLCRRRENTLLLRAQLGRERIAEVVGLEHGADLDLALRKMLEGAAPEPLYGVLDRVHAPQPEAGDPLLGLGERTVGHGPAGELDAYALRARVQTLPGEQDAGLDQLFVERAHLGQQLVARHHAGLRLLARLD